MGGLKDELKNGAERTFSLRHSYGRLLLTILLLAVTLAASSLSERRRPDFLRRPLRTIPMRISGWTAAQEDPSDPLVAKVLQPTDVLSRLYHRNGQQLRLFIAFFAQQTTRQGLHSPKHCLPGGGWEIWRYSSLQVPVQGRLVKLNNYSIQRSGERMLVLYWYQSRQRIIASEYLGKIMLVRDALFDGRTAASLVRIILKDQPGAIQSGADFAAPLIPEIQRCFGN